MDLNEDEDLRKSVIEQMMGELDDVAADGLKKKPEGEGKGGVEIAITVTPKTGEEMKDELEEAGACMDKECEDPMHDHSARDAEKGEGDENYIHQLLDQLG